MTAEQFDWQALLGRTLTEAETMLRAAGVPLPACVETMDPRGGHPSGTPRVVRVRENMLCYARFLDGTPTEKEAAPDA